MSPTTARHEPQARAAALVNLMVDARTGAIVAALREREVPCLLLRGPVTAARLYDRGEVRPYTDCDLLVRERDLVRAEAVLAQCGLARDTARERVVPRWQRHAHSWFCAQRRFHLELHWTLVHVGAEPETLWRALSRDAVSMSIAGVEVPTPGDAALAVILALHAAQHGSRWARPQDDLDRALHRLSPGAWPAAAGLARELDALPAFAAGLRLTPAGRAMAGALALPAGAPFEVLMTSGRAGRGVAELDRFLRAPGIRAKLAIAWDTALPAPARMRETRAIARRGRAGLALAYAWQPLHVLAAVATGLRHRRAIRRTSRAR